MKNLKDKPLMLNTAEAALMLQALSNFRAQLPADGLISDSQRETILALEDELQSLLQMDR